MPVSGLVISLADDPDLRHNALSAIRADPRIEIGVLAGARIAVAVDTDSTDEDQLIWLWLNGLPGVLFVDVAFVSFDPLGDAEPQSESDDHPSIEQTIEPLHDS